MRMYLRRCLIVVAVPGWRYSQKSRGLWPGSAITPTWRKPSSLSGGVFVGPIPTQAVTTPFWTFGLLSGRT